MFLVRSGSSRSKNSSFGSDDVNSLGMSVLDSSNFLIELGLGDSALSGNSWDVLDVFGPSIDQSSSGGVVLGSEGLLSSQPFVVLGDVSKSIVLSQSTDSSMVSSSELVNLVSVGSMGSFDSLLHQFDKSILSVNVSNSSDADVFNSDNSLNLSLVHNISDSE